MGTVRMSDCPAAADEPLGGAASFKRVEILIGTVVLERGWVGYLP